MLPKLLSRTMLVGICHLGFLLSASAFPAITNASFEADGDGVVWPGTQQMSGWVAVGNVGINPLRPEYQQVGAANGDQYFRYAFANNGKTPDGTHVVYLQCSQENDVRAAIRQPISGFESGKTYVLRYYENRRHTYGNDPFAQVKIGDHVVVQPHRVAPAVDGLNVFQKAFYRRISAPFSTNSDGPHILEVSMNTDPPNAKPVAQAPQVEIPKDVNDHRRSEGSLLVDNFQFIELGTLELMKARRNFNSHTVVTATFSDAVADASVSELINYFITDGSGIKIGVVSAQKGADAKTVILTTDQPLDEPNTFTLRVEGILDATGKGMFPNKSSVPIDITARVPADFSTSMSGFQDDFTSVERDPAWVVQAGADDVYRQAYGLLRVRSSEKAGNHLTYRPATSYNASTQEVLAKIRIVESGVDNGSGGISAAVDAASGAGINLLFRETSSGRQMVIADADRGESAPAPTNWQPYQWWWIRLRHQPGAADGDAVARAWPADSETSEPDSWQSFKYPQGTSPRSGFAGISAAMKGTSFDIDYILIKAEGLPPVTPILPAALPPALTLQVKGSTLVFSWPVQQGQGLFIESTETVGDPLSWIQPFGTDSELYGERFFQLDAPLNPTFFRLRGF